MAIPKSPRPNRNEPNKGSNDNNFNIDNVDEEQALPPLDSSFDEASLPSIDEVTNRAYEPVDDAFSSVESEAFPQDSSVSGDDTRTGSTAVRPQSTNATPQPSSSPLDNLFNTDDDQAEPEPVATTPTRGKVRTVAPTEAVDQDIDDEPEDEDVKPATSTVSKKTKKKIVLSKGNSKKAESKEKNSAGLTGALPFGRRNKPKPELDDTLDEEYIDVKNLELKPFGRGKKNKKSEEENVFDRRRDAQKKAKIVQWTALGLAGALVLFSGVRTVMPSDSLSEGDVQNIVSTQLNDTGFPTEAGKGFAKDFMQAYMTMNTDQSADRVLSYYYTGDLNGVQPELNRQAAERFQQKVLYGPTVYKTKSLTPTSAAYVVGALVQEQEQGTNPPNDGSTARWQFFNVNVYYDVKNNAFSITNDSPAVVPNVQVAQSLKVPDAQPLGTDQVSDDVTAALQSPIEGFIKGYAISSQNDHAAIDQYITSDADANLNIGLNKRYTLEGASPISYTSFTTSDPNVVKSQVKVIWTDRLSAQAVANYSSTYVMTLVKQPNGKYLVSKFAPQYYVPSNTPQG